MSSPQESSVHREKLKFEGVVLVCGECQDRSDGPRKLPSRDARKLLKRAVSDAQHRLRVVECGCLGLCPRKAMAVVAMCPGTKPLGASLSTDEEAVAFGATVVAAERGKFKPASD